MRRANTWQSLMERVNVCNHGEQCNQCCWLWVGPVDKWGYGKANVSYKCVIVHREIYKGKYETELTKEQLVLHTCDNRVCCNWWHLYIGDHKRNATDKMERGRFFSGYRPKGIEQKQSILNEHKVRQMRRLYNSGGWTIADIQYVFGVSFGVAQRVLSNKDWKHLQGEVR